MLIDLSSTNGCFVNGRRIREHHLRDGDLIAVGHHQMRFTGPSAKPRGAEAQQEADSDTTLVTTSPETLQRTSSH